MAKFNSINKCKYKEFDCKVKNSLKVQILDLKRFIDNPLHLYEKSKELDKVLDINEKDDSDCENCIIKMKTFLNKILEILHEFQIIKSYIEFKSNSKENGRIEFYQELFQKGIIKSVTKSREINNGSKRNKLTSYVIGNKSEFKVYIFRIQNVSENLYDYNLNVTQELNGKYISNLINDINLNFDFIDINRIILFEELVEIYREKAFDYINRKYRFTDSDANKIALYASLKRLNLFKIFIFHKDYYRL